MLIIPMLSFSENLTKWNIIQNQSTIAFKAMQNNAPISGQFVAFTGNIYFDPAKLNSSTAEISVDMNSVMTSYDEIAKNLKTDDWFNVSVFPKAIFKSNQFTKVDKNTYQVTGVLTIKDKTIPLTISFILEEYTQDKAHVKGSFFVKRTQFNIGQGDWSNTDNIKDDVQVDFNIFAEHTK